MFGLGKKADKGDSPSILQLMNIDIPTLIKLFTGQMKAPEIISTLKPMINHGLEKADEGLVWYINHRISEEQPEPNHLLLSKVTFKSETEGVPDKETIIINHVYFGPDGKMYSNPDEAMYLADLGDFLIDIVSKAQKPKADPPSENG